MPSLPLDEEDLVSVARAAKRLSVSEKTIRRQFDLVRIGDRTLVRVADIRRLTEG
jgi:DeoR/GlpR family transcriptional regulator of sugar metabolism